MPRIIPTFRMLLPTTFPIVMAAFDFKAAVMETKASGRLVPIATIVSPIISWGMPKRDAILLDPSTNQSAPFSSRINPNTNKMIKLSVTLNSNTTHAKRKATELLQARFYDVLNKAEKKQLEKINSLTFIQVATEWLEYSSSCIKVSTILNHKNYIKRIEKAISNMLFVDFTPAIAEKIIFDMYYTEKLSYSYSNATLIIIKSIMRYAKKSKYVQDISDFIDIKLRKRTATKKEVQRLQNKFLNADELKSCLQRNKSSHWFSYGIYRPYWFTLWGITRLACSRLLQG